jgi:hypothetical protein
MPSFMIYELLYSAKAYGAIGRTIAYEPANGVVVLTMGATVQGLSCRYSV